MTPHESNMSLQAFYFYDRNHTRFMIDIKYYSLMYIVKPRMHYLTYCSENICVVYNTRVYTQTAPEQNTFIIQDWQKKQ